MNIYSSVMKFAIGRLGLKSDQLLSIVPQGNYDTLLMTSVMLKGVSQGLIQEQVYLRPTGNRGVEITFLDQTDFIMTKTAVSGSQSDQVSIRHAAVDMIDVMNIMAGRTLTFVNFQK